MRTPVRNDRTRLFLNRAATNRCPSYGHFDYMSLATLGNISRSKSGGSSTKILSPERYGEYETIFYDSGIVDPGSSSLSVHYTDEQVSIINDLFESECLYDAQLHIGDCGIPSNENSYVKAIMLYGIDFTSHDIESPYADASANRAIITESSNITFQHSLEVIKPTLHILTDDIFENGPIVNAGFYFKSNCSSMCGVSNGLFVTQLRYDEECDQYFYWIVYNDNCQSDHIFTSGWEAYQDLYNPLENVVKLKNTLRLTDDSLYHAGTVWPELFYNVPTNFPELINRIHVAEPLALNSFIYKRTDNAMVGPNFVSIFDYEWQEIDLPGNVTYYDVDYRNDKFIVVGTNGTIRLIEKNGTYSNIPFVYNGVTVAENIHKVAYLDNDTYLIATTTGKIFKTINGGQRWKLLRENLFVEEWSFFDHYIGYIAAINNTGNLGIYQTINGGYSLNQLGENYNRNYHVLELKINVDNPNYFVVSGRVSLLSLTNDELILPTTNSALTDKGFIIIGK